MSGIGIHRGLLQISITGVVILCIFSTAIGQQEWSYSQYLFNLYDINAAYAGNHSGLSTAMRYRSQWNGIEGAPQTQQVSAHMPFHHHRLNAGIRIQRESIGARRQWLPRISVGYRIPIKDGGIGFALAGGVVRQELGPGLIQAKDWNDVQLNGQQWNSTTVVFDAALFVHTSRWFAGVEANRLNRASMDWSPVTDARSYMNFNLTSGYYARLSSNDLLAFTGMLRATETGQYSGDVNLTWLWNNKLWLGGGYRFSSAAVVMTMFNVTKQLRIGYNYDFSLNALRSSQDGSHEIFLGYNLKPQDDRSIRQF